MNLPSPATFVGRDTELAEISRLLAEPACRLLTLVGPGGIGKTRLAIEAARQFALPNGIHFVPLQPLIAADDVVLAIADALDFQFSPGIDPEQQLLDYLREKTLLLVLDNFEHLMDKAGLLSSMVAHTSGVRLLVTSRERLNLVGEWVLEVDGLAYPPSDEDTRLDGYSAVSLFTHHARRVNSRFVLKDDTKLQVSRICRLLGGMPLGIELAAAWVRALSCAEIARELERNLDLLETPARDVEPRHRSIRIAFEPTWAGLSEEERSVFRKLSVFHGGCTRQAAEAVAGASLRSLSALVDKALLRGDATGRYNLHELLRQYGEEQLNDCGEADVTRDSHCAYYAGLLERLATELKGPSQVRALDEIEAELDNIRVSWRWAVAHGKEREVRQSMDALLRFYQIRSRYVEGAEAFELAVKRFGTVENEFLGQLLLLQGWFLQYGFISDELACLKKAMRLLHRVGLHTTFQMPLRQFVYFADAFGGYEAVRQTYQDLLAWATQKGDEWGAAWAYSNLGMLAYNVGKYADAPPYFQEGRARFRTLGDRWASSYQASGLGLTTQKLDNFEEARQYHLEHLTLCQEAGDKYGVRWAFNQLALVARALGAPEASRQYTIDSLKLALELGSRTMWATLLWAAGHMTEAEGRPEQAVELYATLSTTGLNSFFGNITGERAILQGLDTLKAQLPSEMFAVAFRRGEASGLRATVTRLLEQLIALDEQRATDSKTDRADRLHSDLLTDREAEILRLIADGLSNGEIAERLVLATSTIKWYVNEIFGKLHVTSRIQAVTRGRELRILT